MNNSEESSSEAGRRLPDGISCVGLLLLIVVVLATLGVGLGGAAFGQNTNKTTRVDVEVGAAEAAALAETVNNVSPTRRATATATVTSQATATRTQVATAIPTMTPASAQLPTQTSELEVNRLVPHTAVPTGTPTEVINLAPLPTPQDTYSWTLKVPILMYHYISEPPEGADKYRIDLSVHPEAFREQMHYLAENGYSPVTLNDLTLAIVNKRELPPRPIVITLDDGYRDNYEKLDQSESP